jgi:hypothetical protein
VTAPDGRLLWDGLPAFDVLGEFASGFSARATGERGLAIVNGHFGRPRALRTHPVDRNTPCVLGALVDVPKDKQTRVVLDVSHDSKGDWQLVVKANGKILRDEVIGPNITRGGWTKITVDLSEFAGRKVDLELLNQANDWMFEYGYWERIAIVSQAMGTSPQEPAGTNDQSAPFMHPDELSGARSRVADVPTTVTFVNKSQHTVKVYWLNYQGRRVLYKTLRRGQSYKQGTALTHPWVITDENDRAWSVHYPTAAPLTVNIEAPLSR